MMKPDDRFKPCPFCGHKGARVTERRENRRNFHWMYDDEWLRENMAEWLHMSEEEKEAMWVQEVVVKVSANVMCNACKAKGGTAVGFVKGYPRPSVTMSRQFNCEPLENIHGRAIENWNRRVNNG